MRLLFLSVSMSISIVMLAQQYESVLGKNETIWTIVEYTMAADSYFIARAEEDTIANGNVYKVIRYYHRPTTDIFYPVNWKRGYLRESADGSKLWYAEQDLASEQLIMDLDLSKGDSFYFHGLAWRAGNYPVDSISYKNNKKHIHLTIQLNDNNVPLQWDTGFAHPLVFIEGMGPDIGLQYQQIVPNTKMDCAVDCFIKDSVFVKRHSASYCARPDIVADITHQSLPGNEVSIYPNPAKQDVSIRGRNIRSIGIYDITGRRLIFAETLSDMITINIDQIPPGVYMVEISGINFTTKKLVIKER